jgi:CO/xanthine dehydrogenase Mo-binding subunit
LALALRVAESRVTVRHAEGAGCYGHNGADDVALDAALLARAVPGHAVKTLWMREDEFGWAPVGPAMVVALRASLDDTGHIVAWHTELWANGHGSRPTTGRTDDGTPTPALLAAWYLEPPFARPPAVNPPHPTYGAQRNSVPLYAIPARVDYHYVRAEPLRPSALRTLGAYGNVFAIESFMDELADAAGIDPVDFRLRHLDDERAKAVIEAAAARANWQAGARRSRSQGVAFARYKNHSAYCAVVADVEIEREVRVKRLVCAVDVGLVVNPDGVANQIEGGAVQATSWTLKEEVRYGPDGITSVDWETYPILGFAEVPAVDVVLIDRPEQPSLGAGEAVAGPVAAAIANAVASLLGVRVRDLPLTPRHIELAMA